MASSYEIPDHRPFYKVLAGKFFGPDDTLYQEGDIVGWDDEPNLEMKPLNKLAREKMEVFLKKLDKFGREVAEKAGKSYTSLADAHANSYALAQQEGKRVEVLNRPAQVPLMGANKKSGLVEKVEIEQEAPIMGSPGKLSLGYKNQKVDVAK